MTALVAVALLVASAGFAQTTGRIQGSVRDSDGAPLPGVTVTAVAPVLPGNVVATSGTDGSFRLLSLPPGVYDVTAVLEGFNTVEQREIRVGIDRTVSLELTMTAAFAGELTVLGDAPVVDTSSATTGISVSAETFERVPLARDFYAIAKVATGAGADTVGATIYGSTGAENAYVIEGLNTTGIERGEEGKTLNFDFIQEVEVKTGGLQAEYGRLTGGLINAITKSGGNEFNGDAFGFFEGSSLISDDTTIDERPLDTTSITSTEERTDYGFDLGGYFVKDKLWFFLAYNRVERTDDTEVVRPFRTASGATVPGTPAVGTVIPLDRESDLYAGKLTWRINSNNNLSVSIFGDPETREGNIFAIQGTPSTYLGTLDFGSDDFVARYDGVFGGSWVVEAMAGLHQEEELTGGLGSEVPLSLDQTVSPNVRTGGFAYHQDSEFEREVLKVDVSKFLGNLEFKFGADQENMKAKIDRFQGGAGQIIYKLRSSSTGQVYYRHRYYVNDRAPGYDRSDPSTWQVAVPLTSEPDSEGTAAYAQTSWKAAPNFTLNLGVRWEEQVVNDRDGQESFSLDDNWAPRVSFIWDPQSTGRSKLFGSFGRYYENIPMDINIRAFGGEVTCFCYNFSPDAGALAPDPAAPSRSSLLGGATPVDPDLKGQYIDEVILGYEYEVMPNFAIGIQGTWRDLGRVIEDFLIITEDNYFIANPGSGIGSTMTFYDYSTVPAVEASREFLGIELNARKRYSNGWQLYASYLWSELEGNYDGLFQNSTGQLDPNINSAFDYADFLMNADGKLSNDRTHTVKLNGSYTFQEGALEGFNIGASAYWESGTPLTAQGYSPGYANYEFYLTPRGSLGRGPSDYEMDLHLGYPVQIGEYELQFLVDVFNLLDRQSIRRLDQRYNRAEDGACTGISDGVAPGLEVPCGAGGGLEHQPNSLEPVAQLPDPKNTSPNPSFLERGGNRTAIGADYTAPRSIRVGVRFRF
jgi:hypothetical protein